MRSIEICDKYDGIDDKDDDDDNKDDDDDNKDDDDKDDDAEMILWTIPQSKQTKLSPGKTHSSPFL